MTTYTSPGADSSSSEEIKVYPNPASSSIYISLNRYKDIGSKVVIYNINGQMVVNQRMNDSNHQIDLTNVTDGLYMLVISDTKGNTLTSKRIIVKH